MIFKSLELAGFKSFADKTRFEFSDGITIVVGPNGSGKSNVVDSIKWALGEQKVKSLRGKEMTDVIFAGAPGRKPMNSAEVTLTFDNSDGRFRIDASELQISRRVMRSGESEYLINNQPCRLKDIRDALAGAGIGTQAYCIIEQGRVDALLQSSPKDRRAIFEEAAGVSRYNNMVREYLKVMERATINLNRLKDTISEQEGRLKSLKRQADKAAKYSEYTQRLQALRTEAGIVDWNNLTQKIEAHDARFEGIRQQGDQLQAQLAELENEIAEIESNLAQLDRQALELENNYSDVREFIASSQTNADNQIRRLEEIHQQQNRYQNQAARLTARTAEQSERRNKTYEEFLQASEQREELALQHSNVQSQLNQLQKQADDIEAENEKCRAAALDKTRTVAALTNEISSLERQLEAKDEHRRNDQLRLEQAQEELDKSAQEKEAASVLADQLNDEKETCEERVQELQMQLDDILEQFQRRKAILDKLGMRRTALLERVGLLEELQNKRDELNPGLKDALKKAKENPEGPFGSVIGLAADMMKVGADAAGLIEVALGQKAEYLVIGKQSQSLISALRSGEVDLSGRVGFIWLDGLFSTPISNVNLEGRPGVVGRADQFVQAEKKYQPLVRRLLGTTWIVETAADAFSLSTTVPEPLNYVTLAGERLSADGSFSCGQRQRSGGSMARRSEWEEKKKELKDLDNQYSTLLAEAKKLEDIATKRDQSLEKYKDQLRKIRAKASEAINQLTALEERNLQAMRRKEEIVHSMTKDEEDRKTTQEALEKAIDEKKTHQVDLSKLEDLAQELRSKSDQVDEVKRGISREATKIQVQLAQCEERCEGLKNAVAQDDKAMEERIQDINQCGVHLREQAQAELTATMSFLNLQSQLATLYLKKEELQLKLQQARKGRDIIANQRRDFNQKRTAVNKELQKIEKQLHAAEMEKADWEHQRSDMAQRLKEDYDIDIAALSAQNRSDDSPVVEVSPETQTEIKQLRNKINALGAVNMEALRELESLQAKFDLNSSRYEDCNKAKQNLETEIRNNKELVQKRFMATVEAVRSHFNGLFSDLFGGGRAEIVIDETEDISEAGIEIIAQPPGKELTHISLLSGGEKTLTCVALLLAMFQSNPSPFCILDEVDAALDEANTERFGQALKRFENITQFICISHSKRTMAVADTIYGITMQESGVSRQLSVRFEDVTEDGDIILRNQSA